LLALIPSFHFWGGSTQGLGRRRLSANADQCASTPGTGAEAGGAEAGGAEAGGAEAGGTNAVGAEAGGACGGERAAGGGASGARAGAGAVAEHTMGGRLPIQQAHPTLTPIASGRWLLVSMVSVAVAGVGPCSLVGGVGPGTAAGGGAPRGVSVIGVRFSAWWCGGCTCRSGGGTCRCGGVAKQPGAAAVYGSGTVVAAGGFQLIRHWAASMPAWRLGGLAALPIFC